MCIRSVHYHLARRGRRGDECEFPEIRVRFPWYFFLLSHVSCNNCTFYSCNTHTLTHIRYIYIYTILAIYKCISIRQPITCNSAINICIELVQGRSSKSTDSAGGEHQKLLRAMHKQRSSLILKKKNKREHKRTYKNMKNKREIIELLIYIIKNKAFNTNNLN